MPTYEYKCSECGIMEIFHGMKEDDKTICPNCNSEGLKKLISSGGAVIIKGKEVNQYNDVLKAKYWRDKNGVRHKVTQGDGHSGSGTINRKIVSDEVVASRKKAAMKRAKKKRNEDSYKRFLKNRKSK